MPSFRPALITPQSVGDHWLTPTLSPTNLITGETQRIADIWDVPVSQWTDPNPGTWAYIANGTENQANWLWSKFDSFVLNAAARGQEIVYPPLVLNWVPDYAVTGSNYGPVILSKLDTFTRVLVARMRSVTPTSTIVIGGRNEPDGAFAAVGGTATDLYNEQQTIYNAVKAVDSTVLVHSPDMANMGTTGQSMLNSFLSLGGGNYCDFLGVHGYSSSATNILTFTDLLNKARVLFGSYGQRSKDFWITELGVDGSVVTDLNDQMAFMAKVYLLGFAFGFKRVLWYAPDGYQSSLPWLLGPHGQMLVSASNPMRNSVGDARQQVYSWLNGSWMVDRDIDALSPAANLLSATSTLCTVPIRRANGWQGVAAWAEDRSAYSFTTPSYATRTYDLAGNVTTSLGATITLSFKPLLIASGEL